MFQKEDGSYAALYQRTKNKDPEADPWYKVYNLNDYKKMQREVRLNRGTLGPDLDTMPYRERVGSQYHAKHTIKATKTTSTKNLRL